METMFAFDDLPWAALVATTLLTGIAALAIYLRQWWSGKATAFWRGNLVPGLPLRWLWGILAIVWLVFHYVWIPYLLPMVSIVVAALAIIFSKQLPTDFWNLRGDQIRDYFLKGIKVFFVMLVPIYVASVLYRLALLYFDIPLTSQPAVDELLKARREGKEVLFFLEALVLAPLWEEIIFRGFLYPFFKAKWGQWMALMFSSLLFAGMHAHLPTFFPLMFFGVILGWTYERYGSLGYPIALHAVFNVISSIYILLLSRG
ncbi:MAG: CPBP family intramembrane glutamic endopeptidase [Verrucomicrobiota bacterium]